MHSENQHQPEERGVCVCGGGRCLRQRLASIWRAHIEESSPPHVQVMVDALALVRELPSWMFWM